MSQPVFILSDHLGSATTTLNAGGSKTADLRFDPWGNARRASGTTPTSYRYTGQRDDTLLGLYDYRARYYDPSIGRFISADTIVPSNSRSISSNALTVSFSEFGVLKRLQAETTGENGNVVIIGPTSPGTLNRYAYGNNRPLMYNDPSGHSAQSVIYETGGGNIGPGFAGLEIIAILLAAGSTWASLQNSMEHPDIAFAAHDKRVIRGQAGALAEHLSKLLGGASIGGFPGFDPGDEDPDYKRKINNRSYSGQEANGWLRTINNSLRQLVNRNPNMSLKEILTRVGFNEQEAAQFTRSLQDAYRIAEQMQTQGVNSQTLDTLRSLMNTLGVPLPL